MPTLSCCAPCRQRRTPEGRQFGASLVSVGVAATLYHATRGRLRSAMRKLDYWTISLCTSQMVRALHPGAPKVIFSPKLTIWLHFQMCEAALQWVCHAAVMSRALHGGG